MSHSILPPSSAAIWGAPTGCTSWVLMNQAFEDISDTEASEEGTAAHWVGEGIIRDAMQAMGAESAAKHWVGKQAPNGVEVTLEMYQGAKLYADSVASTMRSEGVFAEPYLGIEQRVEIPRVHGRCYGTPDVYLFSPANKRLHVWDFKFGFSVVEALDNWQAVAYVAGLLDRFAIDGLLDQDIEVHIHIIQPRARHRDGSARTWVVQASDLRAPINHLAAMAERALGPESEYRYGPHCKHCVGRHACPAAIEALGSMFDAVKQGMPLRSDPGTLGTQLRHTSEMLKHIKSVHTALEERVKFALVSGEGVPGWGLTPVAGRKAWKITNEEVAKIDKTLVKPLAVVTPRQAEGLGIASEVVDKYSHRPRSSTKLAPVDLAEARAIFK